MPEIVAWAAAFPGFNLTCCNLGKLFEFFAMPFTNPDDINVLACSLYCTGEHWEEMEGCHRLQ
jgi:hypothetical protein